MSSPSIQSAQQVWEAVTSLIDEKAQEVMSGLASQQENSLANSAWDVTITVPFAWLDGWEAVLQEKIMRLLPDGYVMDTTSFDNNKDGKSSDTPIAITYTLGLDPEFEPVCKPAE
jgi:hypothetical protein